MSHLRFAVAVLPTLAVYLATAMVACTTSAAPPHIVVYLSDDHSQADSSLYGNDNIPTPQMERMAAAGMTFQKAFVASPSCAPSRAALLTGLMPARNGAEANHTIPRPGTHSLIVDLQSAGYEVVAFGKIAHNSNNDLYGFDHSVTAKQLPKLRDEVSKYLAERQSDKPLCLFVGTSNPHVPWPRRSSFDVAEVQLPPHHLDTPAARRHRAAYYEEIKQLDAYLGELRSEVDEQLGPNTVFVHSSDHGSQWAFGKWNLYDYGTRVPLIVTWPNHIKAGASTDAMVSWVDLIPTLLELAGTSAPQGIDGQSFADVLRGETQEHRDRIFTTHTADGNRNRYPIRSIRTGDWKLIHNLNPEAEHTNHSDIDRKPLAGRYWDEWDNLAKTDDHAREIVHRYHTRPEWELYHVAEDPWELKNLAADPQQAERLAAMQQELADWCKTQGE